MHLIGTEPRKQKTFKQVYYWKSKIMAKIPENVAHVLL